MYYYGGTIIITHDSPERKNEAQISSELPKYKVGTHICLISKTVLSKR